MPGKYKRLSHLREIASLEKQRFKFTLFHTFVSKTTICINKLKAQFPAS